MDDTMLKIPNEPFGHLSTEHLSLALDEMLDTGERQAFDNHVQACEACRRQWLAWSRISDTLQVEPFSAPAPGFMLRVDQAIQRDEKRRERLWGGVVLVGGTLSIWTVLLIGLALALTVGITVIPGARPSCRSMLEVAGGGAGPYAGPHDDSETGLLALLPGPAPVGMAAVWRCSRWSGCVWCGPLAGARMCPEMEHALLPTIIDGSKKRRFKDA